MSKILSINRLSAGYSSKTILKDISFALNEKEITAIAGENGCGKTTLLKCVCSLVRYTGDIIVNGSDIRKLDQRKRAGLISYMPARPSIPQMTTVKQAVAAAFYPTDSIFSDLSKSKSKVIDGSLDDLGISEYKDIPIENLSSGQRQLAVFARSVIANRPLMVLDEPDSSLDFSHRKLIYNKLKSIVTENSCAALICSHDINTILRHADRLILIKNAGVFADIDLRNASRSDLESALTQVYSDTRLYQYENGWFLSENEN